MTDSLENFGLPCFDATPHLRLIIDKEGRWFQNGVEIIHPLVLKQFLGALERKPEGGYRIRIGREICSVEVEDTPFIVSRIIDMDGRIGLELNDGSREVLNPETLWINRENIPYVAVKNGEFPARLSRPAYYELAGTLDFDDTEQAFVLKINGQKWRVRQEKIDSKD